MLFYVYTHLSFSYQNKDLTTKLAKILEDRGILSKLFSNFAVENRAKELAQTSEKVLFELSLLSKFSQNLLIIITISQ